MSLGCGDYRVLVHQRDTLGRAVLEFSWSSIRWGRALDETSAAEVSGGSGCCADLLDAFGELKIGTWAFTLAIVRIDPGVGARRVWSGPVVGIRDTADAGLVLSARDISAWLDRRRVHDSHFFTAADPATIYQDVWDDAMAPDPVEDYALDVTPTALTADREFLPEQHLMAGDTLRELGSLLDWTVIDRVHYVGGQELDTPALGPFIDSHFTRPPDVEVDGLGQANSWIVAGSGGGAEGDEVFGESTATPGPEGLLEAVASEPDVLDSTSADDSAASRLARSSVPLRYVREGILSPEAPVSIDELVPGARVRVALDGRCLPVRSVVRLMSVDVTVGRSEGGVAEQVAVALEPPGSSPA